MASRWTARTGTVTAKYGDGNSIVLEPTEGDFSISGMNAENFEHIKVRNRTKHDGFVEGPDLVQDVTITLQMPRETFTDAIAKKLLDFFNHTGSFAASPSVDSDAVILGWTFQLDVTNGTISGQLFLPLVEGEISIAEGAEFNTITFAGRNHLPPSFT